MAEQQAATPEWIEEFKARFARSMPLRRAILSCLDGQHTNKDIAELLVKLGLYSNLNTGANATSIGVKTINEFSGDIFGLPMITKDALLSPYRVAGHMALALQDLQDSLLPRVVGEDYPRSVSRSMEQTRYEQEIAVEANGQLAELLQSGKGGIQLMPVMSPYIYMAEQEPNRSVCAGTIPQLPLVGASKPTINQLDRLNETLGIWIGEPVYGRERDFVATAGGRGKQVMIHTIQLAPFRLAAQRIAECASLDKRPIGREDIAALEESSFEAVNRYLAGSRKELPHVGDLTIRSTVALLVMLARHKKAINDPGAQQRLSILDDVARDYLAFWGVGTGRRTSKSQSRAKFLEELFEAELGKPDSAECNGANPELFFPERGTSTREAKTICGCCPAVKECLIRALTGNERFGIWGGLSERERRRLRRAKVLEKTPEKIDDVVTQVQLRSSRELGRRTLSEYMAGVNAKQKKERVGPMPVTVSPVPPETKELLEQDGDDESVLQSRYIGIPIILTIVRSSGGSFTRSRAVDNGYRADGLQTDGTINKNVLCSYTQHARQIATKVNELLQRDVVVHNGQQKGASAYEVAELTDSEVDMLVQLAITGSSTNELAS